MPLNWIDSHRTELLELAARLIATPSPNPPGDERAVADVVVAELQRWGCTEIQIAARQPHRPNVLCRLRGGQPGPVLMLCGHSDTKPAGDLSQWRTDPLTPVVQDGRLFGLGATDMKGAVAAMIYALAALKPHAQKLAGELLLVINADEERSMRDGSHYLVTEYGLHADVALLGEPSGIDGAEFEQLHLLSRGVCCFKVRVYGTQMHSSLTDRLPSINANLELAEILTRMRQQFRPSFRPHPLCSAPTINLGVRVEGGVGYGVCPGVAEFQADIRTLPGMTQQQLEADIHSFLEEFQRERPHVRVQLDFEPLPLGWIAPSEVSPDHPLVIALLRAAEHVLGWQPKLGAFPGGSDAASYHVLGNIPTIPSFGPGWLRLAHGPNECVGVESIVHAAKIYALAAQHFLAAPPSANLETPRE